MVGQQKYAKDASSGGRKIDNHSNWIGKPGKGSVFPDGVHRKEESSAEGVGSLTKYEDTTESIRSSQESARSKVKGHQGKLPNQRN